MIDMNVIECDSVTKKFGRLKAVNSMSFSIGENEITGLVGRNGAGKTTLLKVIAGFMKYNAGRVRVFSEDPFNSIKVSKKAIFIDDRMQFPTSMDIQEILEQAGTFYDNWDAMLAQRMLEYFSLDPGKKFRSLSKGMQSTFNMIIGIASRCPLTIFDEPTTGMDSAVRKDFYRALLKDYVKHPRTIIISSHMLSEIEEILEKILLVDEGKLHLHMPVLDLKEYAVALKGAEEDVRCVIAGEKILHQDTYGRNNIYAVVKKSSETVKKAKTNRLEVLPVNTDDLCVYLTTKTKGGIDYVFERE